MRRWRDFMRNYNSQTWSERVDRCRRACCGSGERLERDQKSPGQAGAGNIWIRHKWIATTNNHRSLLVSGVWVEKTTQKNGFCSQMLWFEVIATASEKEDWMSAVDTWIVLCAYGNWGPHTAIRGLRGSEIAWQLWDEHLSWALLGEILYEPVFMSSLGIIYTSPIVIQPQCVSASQHIEALPET